MTVKKTEKPRYRVSIREIKGSPGALTFAFAPGEPRDPDTTRARKRTPRHVVRVSGSPDNPAFNWCDSPKAPGAAQNELEQIARGRLVALHAWTNRVDDLVARVELWGNELGWATRRIEKRLDDSGVGAHKVPALLLQEGTVRVLLEPVSRRAPGANGVVDLYLMPAYDDVASLFYREDNWHVHYVIPGGNGRAVVKGAASGPFSKETLDMLLQELKKHGQ